MKVVGNGLYFAILILSVALWTGCQGGAFNMGEVGTSENPLEKSGELVENEVWAGKILIAGDVIVPEGKNTDHPVRFCRWFRSDNRRPSVDCAWVAVCRGQARSPDYIWFALEPRRKCLKPAIGLASNLKRQASTLV